ncbi:hypothetical protein LTR53_013712 [Teratosphaeriaceae sp. CCFEE 6253]|nr:hypothetical protein LTR53_013712 [Teratosphaeriaceae sp. CCFEE 6253]
MFGDFPLAHHKHGRSPGGRHGHGSCSIPPAIVAHANDGTPYQVDEDELAFLQNEHVGPKTRGWRPLHRSISRQEALQRLMIEPRVDPKLSAAIQRIQEALTMPQAGLDLAIKMFHDLDLLLFHGQLRRRVYMRWATTVYPDLSFVPPQGFGVIFGVTTAPNQRGQVRTAIHMNMTFPWLKAKRWDMIAAAEWVRSVLRKHVQQGNR